MVLLLFLTINKQQIVIAIYDLNQKIMSSDIGVSSFGNLLDAGEEDDDKELTSSNLKTSIIPLTISLIKSIPNIIKYKIFDEDKFDRVNINIDFPDYLTLMRDRDRAIKNSILDNPTKVDANAAI